MGSKKSSLPGKDDQVAASKMSYRDLQFLDLSEV